LEHADPLAALDARIATLRTVRARAERFSDVYWEADDAIAWLRVLRDEVVRTGRILDEVLALLESAETSALVQPDVLPLARTAEPVAAEPVVAA